MSYAELTDFRSRSTKNHKILNWFDPVGPCLTLETLYLNKSNIVIKFFTVKKTMSPKITHRHLWSNVLQGVEVIKLVLCSPLNWNTKQLPTFKNRNSIDDSN